MVTKNLETLLTYHQDYVANLMNWILYRDSYDGAPAIRANIRRYLPQEWNEPNNIYDLRVRRALYFELVAAVVNEFISFIFQRQPVIPEGFRQPDALERLIIENATGDGMSLTQFMKRVNTWAFVYGYCDVMIDMPSDGLIPQVEADVGKENFVVPRTILFTPENVPNWRIENGRFTALRLVQYRQNPDSPFDAPVKSYLYIDRDQYAYYRVVTRESDDFNAQAQSFQEASRLLTEEKISEREALGISLIQRGDVYKASQTDARIVIDKIAPNPHPNGIIPYFRAKMFSPARTIVDTLSQACIAIMGWLSAIDNGIRYNLFPTPVIESENDPKEVGFGTRRGIHLKPANQFSHEPGERVYYVTPRSETAIAEAWRSIEKLVAYLTKIVSLEHTDMLAESLRDVSGVAREMSFGKTSITLTAMASMAEENENKVWRELFAVRYGRYPTQDDVDSGRVMRREYNKIFSAETFSQRLAGIVAIFNLAKKIPSETGKIEVFTRGIRLLMTTLQQSDYDPEVVEKIIKEIKQNPEALRSITFDGVEPVASQAENELRSGLSAERLMSSTEK